MKTPALLAVFVSLAALSGGSPPVLADTAEAMCEFFKHGDRNARRSGPCTFSQRQGYIDIDLRNGDTFQLRPGERPDHFHDQNDHQVVRKKETANKHVYKWDEKKVVVTFSETGAGGSHGKSRHGSSGGQFGETPENLRDLIGARGGQAEDELRSRGYALRSSSKSGDSVYSNWKESSTGRCVTVRTENGRYASIIYSTESDCKR